MHIFVLCTFISPRKQNRQIRLWGGMSNSSRTPMSRQKPSAGIIAHGVGGTTMRLLGASLVHRRWYGPKQPAAMISRKKMWVVKQRSKTGGQKYRGVRYIFYVTILKINLRFRTRIKLVRVCAWSVHSLIESLCRYCTTSYTVLHHSTLCYTILHDDTLFYIILHYLTLSYTIIHYYTLSYTVTHLIVGGKLVFG